MDGSNAGAAVAQHNARGHFTAGHTEYRAKKERIAALVDQLVAEYGATTPAQKQLIAVAARHLDEAARSRRAEIRTRASNCANRLLKLLPRRETAPAAPRSPTLAEYLDND